MQTITPSRTERATSGADLFQLTGQRLSASPGNKAVEPDAIAPSPPMPEPGNGERHNFSTNNSTDKPQTNPQGAEPLIRLTTRYIPPRRFEMLQQWEGVVTETNGNSLWADLHDLSQASNPIEIVELPLAEIPLADQPLLKPGSVFYWSIGYETSPGGQIRRVSEIRVRRSPEWPQSAIDAISAKSNVLYTQFTEHGKEKSSS